MPGDLLDAHLKTLGLEIRGGRAETAPSLDSVTAEYVVEHVGRRHKKVKFSEVVQVRPIPAAGLQRPTREARGIGRNWADMDDEMEERGVDSVDEIVDEFIDNIGNDDYEEVDFIDGVEGADGQGEFFDKNSEGIKRRDESSCSKDGDDAAHLAQKKSRNLSTRGGRAARATPPTQRASCAPSSIKHRCRSYGRGMQQQVSKRCSGRISGGASSGRKDKSIGTWAFRLIWRPLIYHRLQGGAKEMRNTMSSNTGGGGDSARGHSGYVRANDIARRLRLSDRFTCAVFRPVPGKSFCETTSCLLLGL